MVKSKKENESERSENYILIRITSPDGENLLKREECKKIFNNLRSYIIKHGGKFYKDESLVLLEDRRPIRHFRTISIPRRIVKSKKIDLGLRYDVAVFHKRDKIQIPEFSWKLKL